MNRRDFLLFRREGRDRVFELSCERLYVRWMDARSDPAADPVDAWSAGSDRWGGEPPTLVRKPGVQDLFDDLERQLARADVLRLTGGEWLADEEFRRSVERLIEGFQARGGRVHLPSAPHEGGSSA